MYLRVCVYMCTADLVIETVTEDEVYELQFGESFATGALDPNAPTVVRDDFALEIAQVRVVGNACVCLQLSCLCLQSCV